MKLQALKASWPHPFIMGMGTLSFEPIFIERKSTGSPGVPAPDSSPSFLAGKRGGSPDSVAACPRIQCAINPIRPPSARTLPVSTPTYTGQDLSLHDRPGRLPRFRSDFGDPHLRLHLEFAILQLFGPILFPSPDELRTALLRQPPQPSRITAVVGRNGDRPFRFSADHIGQLPFGLADLLCRQVAR